MNSFNAIGGYFELHTNFGKHFYPQLLALNTGRNALEYLIIARQYKKIYLPYFTCSVLLEPIKRHDVNYEFYYINKELEPVQVPVLKENEGFLYTNYFGLKSDYISELKELISNNLIIDNAQAFYCEPAKQVDTFYSPRKFFGIPDGAYLATEAHLTNFNFRKDISVDRCSHLLLRLDQGAEAGYEAFRANDDALVEQPIMYMSRLTEAILCGIDYEGVRKKRNENFEFLHSQLQAINNLQWISTSNLNGPMVYPLLHTNESLRQELMKNKIFVATYWPNVLEWVTVNSIEYQLAKNLIPLPIDQRYQIKDLVRIIEIIQSCS